MNIRFAAASFALLTLTVLSAEGALMQVPVSNSSFEVVPSTNGSCCGWGDFPDPATNPNSTWVASNGYASGGYATNPVGDHFSYSPDSTSRYLYLANVGSISQNLNTNIVPGQSVYLDFYNGNDINNGNHLGGGVLTATITIGSQTISQNFDTTNAAYDVWIPESLKGTATLGGNLSISFATVSGTPWLEAVTVFTTPEPGSFVLGGLGAIGLLGAIRRHRRI